MSASEDGAGPDLRLVPVAATAWAAAWWGTDPGLGTAGILLLGGSLVAALLAHRGHRLVAAAVLLVLLTGAGAAGARHHQLGSSAVAELAGQRASVVATVRTSSDVVLHPRRGVVPESATVAAQLLLVEGRGHLTRQRLPVEVRASGERAGDLLQVPAGSTVRLMARASVAEPAEGIAATVTAQSAPELVAGPGRTARAVNHVRAGLRASMVHSPPAQAGLLPSLVVGDTSHLDPALAGSFKATALTHLTAVSGTNLTLTLAFLLTAARALGVRGWWVRIVGLVGVVGFVLVCRAEPSVIRASAMGLVALAGLGLSGGRGRGLRNLCVAVWFLMAVDPWLARSIGFALSALATGGILWWGRRWSDAMATWAPRWLADSIAVPLAAQLATQGVVTAISGNVSVVGLVANALADPFVGPATVLGLLTTLVAVAWPWGAGWLGFVAGWLVQPIIWIARAGGALPAATWRWPGTPLMVVLLVGICLAGAQLVPLVLRRPRACLLLALLLVAACLHRPPPLGWPGPWQVAFCDVGQGDATVLRAAEHQAVVVDTGPADGHVTDCLRALGIRSVPLVVLTHYHDDHVGGLAAVLDSVPVGRLVVNPVRSPGPAADEVQRLADRHGTGVVVATAGEELSIGDLSWRTVGVGSRDVLVTQAEGENSAENDTSIVGVASVHGLRVVVGGDVEPAGEQRITATGWHPGAHILKMPHHGSSRQDRSFWCDSGARLAVASAGHRNTYGHPSRAALALAGHCGMEVARTDLQGTVTAWLADGRLQVRGERDGPP